MVIGTIVRMPTNDAAEVLRLRREEQLGPTAIARRSASAGRASIACSAKGAG
jgi:hypothetical protein